MAIKRYHEAPLCIFNKVQEHTDGDYALVHLLASNDAYRHKFEEAVAAGRDVILDNSIFELGEAFQGDEYVRWINQLKPTWYIVPDCWKDSAETMRMFDEFVDKYPDLPSKRIGVAQGNDWRDVARCYSHIKDRCDMIAFNLDFSSVFYDSIPLGGRSREYKATMIPYCVAMSIGRNVVLNQLYSRGIIDTSKPHHLLGCGVPQEVQWYDKSWTWIRSIDTSNPVMAGMNGKQYDEFTGISWKCPDKLCDNIMRPLNWQERADIFDNIDIMRKWCTTWKES